MAYYHVIIKTHSDSIHEEKRLNLSEQELRSQFVEPYENNFHLFLDGKVIKHEDIQKIKILKTLSGISKNEVPNIQKLESGPLSKIWQFSDVTDHFIKWAPGYRKMNPDKNPIKSRAQSNQIFVVHGHDNEMKQAVARTLEKLGLKPIILHEQPNQGRTIIEKFTDYADNVSFAVILLSPDDVGYRKNQSSEAAKFRARQNVILELGFFLGKLGRNNVAALFKNNPNFERPSDYDGVLYTPFDNSGRWQLDLAQELKSAGYNVDANKLLN